MESELQNTENRFFLCHKAGMCPVLRLDGDTFLVEDDHQSTPGKVSLDQEQARGLLEALKKLFAEA